MAIPTTYSELKTTIEGRLARSDLTVYLPEFIETGEQEINRLLRTLNMETTDSTLSLQINTDSIALPTGFLEEISLMYNSDGLQPTKVSYEDLVDYFEVSTNTKRPLHYAIGSLIEFSVNSDSTRAMTMRYYKAWDLATDGSNALLTANPNLYILAGLYGSVEMTGPHPRSQIWEQRFYRAINELNLVSHRGRRGAKMRVDRSLQTARSFNINTGSY